MEEATILETIALKRLSGDWHIVTVVFQQDRGDSFRTIYDDHIPMQNGNLMKMWKPSRTGKIMYREIANALP